MKLVGDLAQWREVRQTIDQPLGFVATMGALHAGHAELIRRSVAECAVTVVSVFVNPTQFNDPNDLANYPDTLQADLSLAESLGGVESLIAHPATMTHASMDEEARREAGIHDGTGIGLGVNTSFPHQVRYCDPALSPNPAGLGHTPTGSRL